MYYSERRRSCRDTGHARGEQTGEGQENRAREENGKPQEETGKGKAPGATHEIIARYGARACFEVLDEFPVCQATIDQKHVISPSRQLLENVF